MPFHAGFKAREERVWSIQFFLYNEVFALSLQQLIYASFIGSLT